MSTLPLENGGWRTQPGQLASVDYLPRASRLRGQSGQDAPRGLYFRLSAGLGATVKVSCTDHPGGTATRTFSLTPRGAWLSLVGWERVYVQVLTVSGTDTVVEWGLTTEAPPSGQQLLFVETLDSSGAVVAVPEGAAEIAVSPALPAFAWSTKTGPGVPLAQPAPLALAQLSPVLGGGFSNAVPNVTACWILDPL